MIGGRLRIGPSGLVAGTLGALDRAEQNRKPDELQAERGEHSGRASEPEPVSVPGARWSGAEHPSHSLLKRREN